MSAAPMRAGARQLRAPKAWWALMPPAPWHRGMPLIAPTPRLARPRVRARRLGVIRDAVSGKYRGAASAGARQELVRVSGTWGRTSRVAASIRSAGVMVGSVIGVGPRVIGPDPQVVTTAMPMPVATATRALARRQRRRTTVVMRQARAVAATGQCPVNVLGGRATIPHAMRTNVSPTASCTPRMTTRGNTAPRRSRSPEAPRTRNTTPMISEPAAMTSDPAPAAMAAAPNALRGWTATGAR